MPDLPDSLRALPWELPHTFLGLDEAASRFRDARAVILPVPYESTTSYGGGAREGPRAILEASRYLELYDQELEGEPWIPGIATLPPLELSRAGPETACAELAAAYRALMEAAGDRFLVALGGEHSITAEPVLAWADRLAAEGRRLSVLQLDAHTDLRPAYEGTAHSHASVMHRLLDRVDIVAVGIRALTSEEKSLVDARDSVRVLFADDIHDRQDWIDDAVEALGPDVYVTLDVDGFDPSLVPATGTPEPGGLGWYQVLSLLRRVCERRRVHAADIVELAPIPGLRAPDFLVAKLLYKLIAYRLALGPDAAGSGSGSG